MTYIDGCNVAKITKKWYNREVKRMEKDGIYIILNGKKTFIDKKLSSFCNVTIKVKNGTVVHATAEESLKIE